jgi:molybdenum cofactor synthesis domain-containing protein
VNTPTAAVLVVGAEVLSGKVRDENGPFLADRLRALGVELQAIHVVPDRMDAIVEALALERRRVTWVLTSGGVGPTHDDLTLPAVAHALGVPLRRDVEMEALLRAMHDRHHPGCPSWSRRCGWRTCRTGPAGWGTRASRRWWSRT